MKADKDSPNLARLQQASRGVSQATAAVVASTISGKSQIEETGSDALLVHPCYPYFTFYRIPISHSSIVHLLTFILILSEGGASYQCAAQITVVTGLM